MRTLPLFNNHSNNDLSQVSLQPILDLTKGKMEKVNNIILGMAKSQTELIPKIIEYLASAGGKRIRPMLTLASAAMFNYNSDTFDDVKLAAAVEFMHTATLLHDDVVDESDLRRGKQAARKIWGNQASVLVGDFLLGHAFKLMVETGSLKSLEVLSNAACVISEGEVMQLVAAKNFKTTKEDYFKIINAKTAELFSASVSVGAIISGRSKEDVDNIFSYGQNLVVVFQLVDDILDYSGEQNNLGKNIGDDFREGKITLPILLCYNKCNSEEKAFLTTALCEGQSSAENLAITIDLLKKYKSLDESFITATHYANKAKQALLDLSEKDINTEVRQILLNIVDFCICRVN